MTVSRPRNAPDASPSGAVQPAADGNDSPSEFYFASFEATRVDRIALTARASALIAAGLAVRAFLIVRVEDVRQRIAIGPGRWLVFESGLYGIKF